MSHLLAGFAFGFDVGYRGPSVSRVSKNLNSARGNPEVIRNALREELLARRLVGPFSSPPFPNLQCHPLGAVPKKNSVKWRPIYHLSFPCPETDSVNAFISQEFASCSYVSVDDAIDILRALGKGAFMGKMDIRSAFRLLPIAPSQRELFGIFWEGKYYYDKCVGFGLRSAPKLFDQFAAAVEWIARNKFGVHNVIHLLDDFFFVAPPSRIEGERCMLAMRAVFHQLGIPCADEKTAGPSTCVEFLGILLDSEHQVARLPEEKLVRLRSLVDNFSRKRSATLAELQSLLGHLSFACRVIRPGRPFLRSLCALTSGLRTPGSHTRISQALRDDLRMWALFLRDWNGRAFFINPLLPFPLQTDAAGTVGIGAFFKGSWFALRWETLGMGPLSQPSAPGDSMALRELIPIVLAVACWSKKLKNSSVFVDCDNKSVVGCVRKMNSPVPTLASLLRSLSLLLLRDNIDLRIRYISTNDNGRADALSRFQFDRFQQQVPWADKGPSDISSIIPNLLHPVRAILENQKIKRAGK